MIRRVKGAVKAALVKRRIEEYNARLDAQFISYHDWIEEREHVEIAKRKLPVQVVEYSACGKDYKLPAEYSSFGKDYELPATKGDTIFIFVKDKKNLASNAENVICEYFEAHPECMLVYGDEDEWNSNRTIRMNPWFKPDFSPDTLLQYFYYGNVFAVRAAALNTIEWKKEEDCLANLYDMCLQLSFPVEKEKIGHVQYVLYHADNLKLLCTDEAYSGLKAHYTDMLEAVSDGYVQERINVETENKISIVIPSKDHPEILGVCLESLVNTTKNENIEIVVVDNGSNEENRKKCEEMKIKYGFNYIFKPMDFNFSHMCNMGAEAATGKYLLFLNDDIEAVSEGWIAVMRAHASKAHVGAVGAKLYYPNSKIIQHAGITNLRLGPAHKMQFLEDTRSYYDGRNRYDINVLAVTGACLMVRKEVFKECGGFPEDMAVAFNDVELGFHLHELGYYNVQCNSVIMYHHESLSRGSDEALEKQVRLMNERTKLYEKHPDLYGNDPFYHPYLNSVILDADFSFAYEYPAWGEVEICEPKLLKNGLRKEWYNECLLYGFEHVDDLSAWLELPSKSGEELYFQGYQFIVGSDNACFKWSLLLKNTDTQEIWEVPYNSVFRPDLVRNVAEKHAALCGFACAVEKKKLPEGKYQLGCMATSLVSRQRLCRFVNKFTEV